MSIPEINPTISLTSDHLRALRQGGMEVFTALLDQSATATQLSERLGLPRARVNFIIGQLLQDGLIKVGSERVEGDRVERYYRAVVSTFGLQGDASTPLEDQLAIVGHQISDLRKGILTALATKSHLGTCMLSAHARVPKRRIEEYIQRLNSLLQEFDAEQEPDEPWYVMFLALFPEDVPSEGK